MQSFKVGDKIYEIPLHQLEGTMLQTMMTTSLGVNKEEDTIVLSDDPENFQIFWDYINGATPLQPQALDVLNYYYVPRERFAFYQEKYLQENISKPEFKGHEITEPLFNLIHITKDYWEKLEFHTPSKKNFLFVNPRHGHYVNSWDTIQKEIAALPKNNLVAGGSMFGILMNEEYHDIDVFFIKHRYCNRETLPSWHERDALRDIESHPRSVRTRIRRSKYAITFEGGREVQFILRVYTSPSEVLHSFDIDCCGIGLWEGQIYATPRAIRALTKGYNTVDLSYASPGYEYRLAKYAKRGMAVFLEGFRRSNTVKVVMKQPYPLVHTHKYIDRLLLLEFYVSRKIKWDEPVSNYDVRDVSSCKSLDKVLISAIDENVNLSKFEKLIVEGTLNLNTKLEAISYKGNIDGIRGNNLKDVLQIPEDVYNLVKEYIP